MNILVLDACRDNPYQGSGKGLTRGLKKMSPPVGALVALAAAEGQEAQGTDGYYSLYTTHLLEVLKKAKPIRLTDVFMEVHKSVSDASEGQQKPWYQASMRKPLCFGDKGVVECP